MGREDEIRWMAYQAWRVLGSPPGEAETCWLLAEREWERRARGEPFDPHFLGPAGLPVPTDGEGKILT
jgi:hypothetical protein